MPHKTTSSVLTVRVHQIPAWIPIQKLLGHEQQWQRIESAWQARLSVPQAADLAARLRGLVIDGQPVEIETSRKLPRSAVRAARLLDARRRRDTSVGFSDRRAQCDETGRRSLTAEALALSLGERAQRRPVIDAGCGAGGNAIGFARMGCRVTAIEQDRQRLSMARFNSELYGVQPQIDFVHADATQVLTALQSRAELLFVDPPWHSHGRGASQLEDFPLLQQLLGTWQCTQIPEIWAKLPAGFASQTWPGCLPEAIFGVSSGDSQRIKFLLCRQNNQQNPA